jgi:hypothetical protein
VLVDIGQQLVERHSVFTQAALDMARTSGSSR